MAAIITQWVVICLTILLLFWISQGRGSKEKKAIIVYICLVLIENVAYLFEMTAEGQTAAFMSLEVEYGALIFMGYFICLFFFAYTKRHLPKWVVDYALIYNLVILVLVWTGNYHSLIFKNVMYKVLPYGYGLSYERGSLFLFLVFGCELIPFLVSLFLVLSEIHRESASQLRRRIFLAAMIIFISYGCEIFSFTAALKYGYRFSAPFGLLLLDLFVVYFWGSNVFNMETAAIDTVYERMQEGVIVLNRTDELLYFNHAAKEIFPELDVQLFRRNLMRLHSLPLELFSDYETKEISIEERTYTVTRTAIRDPWGDVCGFVLLFDDHTGERCLKNTIAEKEHALLQLQQELEIAREEESGEKQLKGEFLMHAAHEIRTPMNAIVGLAELIMEESRGRKVYDFACDIKNASTNLLRIVDDVFSLTKIESSGMELEETPYCTQQLLEETLHLCKVQAASRGLRLIREISKELPCRMVGDENRIRQLIINSFDFGMSHTKSGYVKLALTHEWIDEAHVMLKFEFSDSGEYIDTQTLSGMHVLDWFHFNGGLDQTGLGTTLSRHFIKQAGGSFEASSDPNSGTRFTVFLPQRVSDVRSMEEHPWCKQDISSMISSAFIAPDCRVLVVDDNKINLKVAVGALSIYHFIIEEAKSGAQAIDMVKNQAYDLIFMDHMMPEMDGIEATEHIRRECGENGKNAVIIALSANAYNNAKDMFIRNGFQDFIAKPLDKYKLYDILCKWIPADRRIAMEGTAEADQKVNGAKITQLYMPGVDVCRAMETHTGGMDDYIELLELYYMDGLEERGLIRRLAEECDYKNYEIEVHGLKSASANIGADELSELAKKHEFAAKEGNFAFIDENLSKLLLEYNFLLREIERVLKSLGRLKDEPTKEEGEQLSAEETKKRMQEILEDVENFRSKEAAAKTDALLNERTEKSAKQCLKDVRNKLKMYDDDTAEELLRAFLSGDAGQE